MFKVCAIMPVFNEEDIIYESVTKLIRSGIDVFIIDNECTDATIKNVEHLVGKGVIDIKPLVTREEGQHVYKLESILEEIENISKILDYDWFIFVDADEIRYSPWPELSLLEGIEKVDKHGFNLINFKLFNFRITEDYIKENDYESSMEYYSKTDSNANIQIKSWKKTDHIYLKKYGGHIAERDNPSLFPVKFIHKHYPIRSIEHGLKKLQDERISKYSTSEKNKGWHSHYLNVNFDTLEGIQWDKSNLTLFNLNHELIKIHSDSSDEIVQSFRAICSTSIDDFFQLIQDSLDVANSDPMKNIEIIKVAKKILQMRISGNSFPIIANRKDANNLLQIFKMIQGFYNLKSQPLHSRALDNIEFMIE